jgi:hypothetical protein
LLQTTCVGSLVELVNLYGYYLFETILIVSFKIWVLFVMVAYYVHIWLLRLYHGWVLFLWLGTIFMAGYYIYGWVLFTCLVMVTIYMSGYKSGYYFVSFSVYYICIIYFCYLT